MKISIIYDLLCYNLIYVYMLQKSNYTINNYIEEFYPHLINNQKYEIIIHQLFTLLKISCLIIKYTSVIILGYKHPCVPIATLP